MVNPKQMWTSEEEAALRAGIAKHGTGKWKDIQRDNEFHPHLASRSNIDLKDKWRNMSTSSATAQLSTPQASSSDTVALDATSTLAVDDSSKGSSDGKTSPTYNEMILEALSTSKYPNGLETRRIASYIEQRRVVSSNFRSGLSTRLRRLVALDKIEKVQNSYKMKSNASSGTKTPTPDLKQAHSQLTQAQNVDRTPSIDPIKEAAEEASRCIADAEYKDALLAESCGELEMNMKIQEEAEETILFAKELYERCSKGEIVQIR